MPIVLNNAHCFYKNKKHRPHGSALVAAGCHLKGPYSFASQAFACFAVFLLHLLPLF